MAHHSGRSVDRQHTPAWVLLRILGPIPLMAFLALAVWAVADRGSGWVALLVVGGVGAVSWLPFVVSIYEGRYDR